LGKEFAQQGIAKADRGQRLVAPGFGAESVLAAAEGLGLAYIMAQRLTRPVQAPCRHADPAWQETGVKGLQVQEVELEAIGRRLVVIRQQLDLSVPRIAPRQYHDLDHLAGTWNVEETSEFLNTVADFNAIDPKLWR